MMNLHHGLHNNNKNRYANHIDFAHICVTSVKHEFSSS